MTPQVTSQDARVIGGTRPDCSFSELQTADGLKDHGHFLKTHLEALMLAGRIERIIPDRLRSSKQKYRLTEEGRQATRKG